MRAGRRLRKRDRPAARAHPAGQQVLGHRPDDVHVDDLRPPRPSGLRAVQAGAAPAALRGRLRGLLLTRVRVPLRAFSLVTGLPAPLAVLPALPLRFLPPRPPRHFRPDPLLRARRPRIRAVHPQPALQLRQPQLKPAFPLPRRFQLRPQRGVLHILRPGHLAQPRQQVTLLRDHASKIRLTRHKRQHAQHELKVQTPPAPARRRALQQGPARKARIRVTRYEAAVAAAASRAPAIKRRTMAGLRRMQTFARGAFASIACRISGTLRRR